MARMNNVIIIIIIIIIIITTTTKYNIVDHNILLCERLAAFVQQIIIQGYKDLVILGASSHLNLIIF